MKKLVLAGLAAAVAVFGLTAGASAQSQASRQHLFVGFSTAPGAAERAVVQRHGGTVRFAFPSVNALAIDLESTKVGELARERGVQYVEQDPVREPTALADEELTPSLTNGLYGLITTRAVNAHAAPTRATGNGVKACVADTGLDTGHPDIAANFVAGFDAFDGDMNVDVFDDGVAATETHGTHVAGTLLGVDNRAGVFGVAPDADLYHARVLGTHEDGEVSGETSQVMAGVQWLADQGCKVVNMSLGGGSPSRTEQLLYDQLIDEGTLIVAAAGNDGRPRVSFPGAYERVVSVAAVDVDNTIASFSNTGRGLDLAAPGVVVLSSVSTGFGFEASATAGGTEFRAFGMEFAGNTDADGFTDTLVSCGLATSPDDCVGEPADGSWVALIQRGSISFAAKVENAMAAGADAAIIYNNVAGDFLGTLGTQTTSTGAAWIPAVSVSDASGAALVGEVGGTATVLNIASAWDHFDGTSMATPHVSGVAALVFGKNPSLTPAQVEAILKGTAKDLGPAGYDTTYGFGIPQADAAVNAAGP